MGTNGSVSSGVETPWGGVLLALRGRRRSGRLDHTGSHQLQVTTKQAEQAKKSGQTWGRRRAEFCLEADGPESWENSHKKNSFTFSPTWIPRRMFGQCLAYYIQGKSEIPGPEVSCVSLKTAACRYKSWGKVQVGCRGGEGVLRHGVSFLKVLSWTISNLI
jgi:hypothetical protein